MAVIKRKDVAPEFGTVEPEKRAPHTLHDALTLRAERWLEQQGCGIVIRDPFRSFNQEQPDAIGWRSDVSILVEVKVSRSDFLADKKKSFRADPQKGMGDWRFYMCPPGVIAVDDLPVGWGLLWVYEKQIKKIHGVPPNTWWSSKKPFSGNKPNENTMLISALRRLKLRGYLGEIYEGPVIQRKLGIEQTGSV